MPSRTRTSRSTSGGPSKPARGQAKTISANPFGALLTTVRAEVDTRLRGYLDAKLDAVTVHGPEAAELVRALRDLCLRGGKRLRAALVVAGFRAASRNGDIDTAIDAGVALELLHAYFLIHDDWMDEDTVRRGGPAVHARLARRFRSHHLGCASGILAGDYAAALATDVLSRLELRSSRQARVFTCFAQMQADAVIGQQLDLIGRARSVESVYALKTASYTVRGPLLLGAHLASAPTRVLTALDRFALPVGVAFQLRDDLLGVFGDFSQTGKPRGSDLRSGKRTVLLTTALRRARGRDHHILKSVVGNPRPSKAELQAAVDVLQRCGAERAVLDRMEELLGRARLALRAGRIGTEARELLEGAARALVDRQL
jgi:geranylgeranyl diphosphate synthase type I